jgi:hypothetical protein
LGIVMPETTTLDLASELRQLAGSLHDVRSDIGVRQAERTALGAQAEELQGHASRVLSVAEAVEDAIRTGSHEALLDAAKRFVEQGVDLAARLERGSVLDQRIAELDDALAEGRSALKEHVAREGVIRADLARIFQLQGDPMPTAADLLSFVDRAASPQDESFLRLQAIQADWLTRFGRNPEFNGALLAQQHVVAATCVGLAGIRGAMDVAFDLCIVDEASKATATETLVPMSRASKWVLVGDQRQLPPFVEDNTITAELLAKYEVTTEQLEETLFARLAADLPAHSKFVLSEQHRMLPAIGDLITHCFYPGLLSTRPRDVPNYVQLALGTPVVWLDTSELANRREEKYGSSRANALEVRLACRMLEKLEFTASMCKVSLSVAVLTGYLAQRDALRNAIERLRAGWPHLTVSVNTVDAFQGREATVCIFSLTRSNDAGDVGFLEKRRVNVALSRGRDALILIGDADHIRRRGPANNPLYEVLQYVSGSDGCTLMAATS